MKKFRATIEVVVNIEAESAREARTVAQECREHCGMTRYGSSPFKAYGRRVLSLEEIKG